MQKKAVLVADGQLFSSGKVALRGVVPRGTPWEKEEGHEQGSDRGGVVPRGTPWEKGREAVRNALPLFRFRD